MAGWDIDCLASRLDPRWWAEVCLALSLIIECSARSNSPDSCRRRPSLQSHWAGHSHRKSLGWEPPYWMIGRNWDRNQVWKCSAFRSRVRDSFSWTTWWLSKHIFFKQDMPNIFITDVGKHNKISPWACKTPDYHSSLTTLCQCVHQTVYKATKVLDFFFLLLFKTNAIVISKHPSFLPSLF